MTILSRFVKKLQDKKLKKSVIDKDTLKGKSFVIRVIGTKYHLLHPDGENNEQLIYVVREGLIGAAIFQKENAQRFIAAGNEPLEMVDIVEFIGTVKK